MFFIFSIFMNLCYRNIKPAQIGWDTRARTVDRKALLDGFTILLNSILTRLVLLLTYFFNL